MWSLLFHDLILASEELLDCVDKSSPQEVVSITVTDTAADLMLLLSCLYPAAHHPDRRQGSTLDAASFLPLLGLADKYHCPHIIQRCAAFAIEHVLPRLAASPSAAAAAEYLQLPTSSAGAQARHGTGAHGGGGAADATPVAEWVVRCLELGARLDLWELVEGTAGLLAEHFFEWDLQADDHRELLTRVARVLPPDQFVDLVVRRIPASAQQQREQSTSASAAKTQPVAAIRARGSGNIGGGGGAAGGGGPRIVPVVVAAAGPAAAVVPQAAAAPAVAPAPAPPQPLQQQQPQAAGPQPFMDAPAPGPPHHHQQQQQQQQQQHPQNGPQHPHPLNAFWQVAFHNVHGGQGGGPGNGMQPQPEPFMGPGGGGW